MLNQRRGEGRLPPIKNTIMSKGKIIGVPQKPQPQPKYHLNVRIMNTHPRNLVDLYLRVGPALSFEKATESLSDGQMKSFEKIRKEAGALERIVFAFMANNSYPQIGWQIEENNKRYNIKRITISKKGPFIFVMTISVDEIT